MQTPVTETKEKTKGNVVARYWNNRYQQEGHIWGDEPSVTAKELTEILASSQKVLEVGFGYGRDLLELVKNGHQVTGVEESSVGLNEALKQLTDLNKHAHLVVGEFTTAPLDAEGFDAVLSHRMLHLIGDNGLVRAFVNAAHRTLKPRGLLYVSARDNRDFNPEEMVMTGPVTAKYISPNREGHALSFWNEARFKEAFGKNFEIISFEQGSEIESQGSNSLCHFTIMKARKKPDRTERMERRSSSMADVMPSLTQ